MSDLSRRSGGPPSRRSREQRAYRLIVVGGVSAAVFVVTAVLAIVGILGWALPVITAVISLICAFMFKRIVT